MHLLKNIIDSTVSQYLQLPCLKENSQGKGKECLVGKMAVLKNEAEKLSS